MAASTASGVGLRSAISLPLPGSDAVVYLGVRPHQLGMAYTGAVCHSCRLPVAINVLRAHVILRVLPCRLRACEPVTWLVLPGC